jgi:hypothetical protein
MSRAVVIDVRKISRAVVKVARKQVDRVRQLFVASAPFLEGAWGSLDDWPAIPETPLLDYPAIVSPTVLSPTVVGPKVQPVTVEPVREPSFKELLSVLSQHGLGDMKVDELPAGAVRIRFEQRQPEYVRVR